MIIDGVARFAELMPIFTMFVNIDIQNMLSLCIFIMNAMQSDRS